MCITSLGMYRSCIKSISIFLRIIMIFISDHLLSPATGSKPPFKNFSCRVYSVRASFAAMVALAYPHPTWQSIIQMKFAIARRNIQIL